MNKKMARIFAVLIVGLLVLSMLMGLVAPLLV